jgi:uncharacterized protein YrrD
MQFKQGTGVFTAEGREVGHIDRVVMDPGTKEVTHVVVRKGFLFTEDKVVPIDMIASATDDHVVLRSGVGNLDTLPLFEETHYIPLEEAEPDLRRTAKDASPMYWYPPIGLAAWGAPGDFGPEPLYATHTEKNIPEGTVALKEGSKVISSDGNQVGNVERVVTDSQTDRATHILISQGLLLTEKKLIPVTWVSAIMEKEVHLMVSEHLLGKLPNYQDKPDQAAAGA